MSDDVVYSSKSSLEKFQLCERRHRNEYTLGLRPCRTELAPAMGNVVHAGFLNGFLAGDGTLEMALATARAHADFGALPEPTVYMIQAVIEACCNVLGPKYREHTVEVEQKKTRYLDGPAVCSDHWADPGARGRVSNDARARDDNTRTTDYFTTRRSVIYDAVLKTDSSYDILDLKTTSTNISPRSYYWSRVDIDRANAYYLAEFEHHYPEKPTGLVWQAVKMPTQKQYAWDPDVPAKAYVAQLAATMERSPEVWFPWKYVTYDQAFIDEYMTEVLDLERRMAECTSPLRNHGSCFAYGRRCPFYGNCWENRDFNMNKLSARKDRNG